MAVNDPEGRRHLREVEEMDTKPKEWWIWKEAERGMSRCLMKNKAHCFRRLGFVLIRTRQDDFCPLHACNLGPSSSQA